MPRSPTSPAPRRTVALLGVPSSAGAHWPGQDKAPRYLRDAGLVARLEEAGLDVRDLGDLPAVRFRPDPAHRRCQNLAAVVDVARRVAERVEAAVRDGAVPLVIGGDCTVGLGTVSGVLRHHGDLGLLYFDGHVDLNTPATSPSGILDSMGVAHLVGEPGAADDLAGLGPRHPLLPLADVVPFGYNPREINDAEREHLARHPWRHVPLPEIRERAAAAAAEAAVYLEARRERFLVHFDADAIDFTDFPVADVPQFSEGLPFRDAAACLASFAASPAFAGLTVTEINPDHAGGDLALAARLGDALATALACGG